MDESYCRPISLDSINPAIFPDISLFMKSRDNYVLYKPHDRKFSEDDLSGLSETM
jgi:hypothetical protein